MLLRNLLVLSIFSILFFNAPGITAGITAVSQIVEIGKDITDMVNAIKTGVNSESNIDSMEANLFNLIEVLGEKVANLSLQLEQNGEHIYEAVNMLEQLPYEKQLKLNLKHLSIGIGFVDTFYNNMLKYINESHEYGRDKLEEFAISIVSHNLNSIPYILEIIYERMVPTTAVRFVGDYFFESLAEHYMDSKQLFFCLKQKSQQQILLNAFNPIILSYLKGYILIQYAYMSRTLYGHCNFTEETRIATNRFEVGISKMLETVKNITMNPSNDLWRCNPEIYSWHGTVGVKSFNLQSTTADIKNNRVMTGLRLVEVNGLIHFQIQEGLLLPGGRIDVKTVHWVSVDDYNVTDPKFRNKIDFITLRREDLAIDLDTLEADDGYILTGIRFQICNGNHVCFEIHVSPFDFESGKLVDPESKGFYKNLTIQAPYRRQLNLNNLDVPKKSSSSSPIQTDNTYLTFTLTNLRKGLTRKMVPFFDTLPVASLQPISLSGAGIFSEHKSGYGDFIAPKIKTLNLVKYMEESLFPIEKPSEVSEKEPSAA